MAADSSHKRLQEESSPSHANFLLNGNNPSQFSNQSLSRSASLKNQNNAGFQMWFTQFFHNAFGCKSCQHRKKQSRSERSRNVKPFTTDSSYTFQRSPPTLQPLSQPQNNHMRPDLLADEDRNFTINSFTSHHKSQKRHGVVDFFVDSDPSHQYPESSENNIIGFDKITQSPMNKVVINIFQSCL